MRSYRRFKDKHKITHILLVAIAIVMFWRGVWGLLDEYFFTASPVISYGLSIFIAFLILYFDDYHLKELHSDE
jgi:hypothetical protein